MVHRDQNIMCVLSLLHCTAPLKSEQENKPEFMQFGLEDFLQSVSMFSDMKNAWDKLII